MKRSQYTIGEPDFSTEVEGVEEAVESAKEEQYLGLSDCGQLPQPLEALFVDKGRTKIMVPLSANSS